MRKVLLFMAAALMLTATAQAQVAPFPVKGTVTLIGDATDVGPVTQKSCGPTSVQFYLDGVVLGPKLTIAPFSLNWDTTKVANGNHTITAKAQDKSGTTDACDGTAPLTTTDADAAADGLVVTVSNLSRDTTPPRVKIRVQQTAELIVDKVVQIQVAADDDSGAPNVQLFIDDKRVANKISVNEFSFPMKTAQYKGRSVVIRAVAIDGSGNTATDTAEVKVSQ